MTKEQSRNLDEFLAVARKVFLEPARARQLRVNDCTQEAFNKLPLLVRAGVFMEWTGLSPDELREEVRAGLIRVLERPGGRRYYYKTEIARMTGLKL